MSLYFASKISTSTVEYLDRNMRTWDRFSYQENPTEITFRHFETRHKICFSVNNCREIVYTFKPAQSNVWESVADDLRQLLDANDIVDVQVDIDAINALEAEKNRRITALNSLAYPALRNLYRQKFTYYRKNLKMDRASLIRRLLLIPDAI